MLKFSYKNGAIIPSRELKIEVNDLGFTRGYGIFDVFKTVGGHPFLLKEHFQRLRKSSRLLDLRLPFDLPVFNQTVQTLLKKNDITPAEVKKGNSRDVYIKTIVTGGPSADGLSINSQPTVVIFLDNLDKVTPAPKLFQKGARLITVEFQRFLPDIKTLNYITAVKNQNKKKEAGAVEILYHHQGKILEGATSNIFLVKNGQLITPAEDILPGTTRNFLLHLCRQNNLPVLERSISLSELLSAEEVFLTGTFKDVLPIIQVDNRKIANGKVGPQTKKCQQLFQGALEIFK